MNVGSMSSNAAVRRQMECRLVLLAPRAGSHRADSLSIVAVDNLQRLPYVMDLYRTTIAASGITQWQATLKLKDEVPHFIAKEE